MSRKRRRSVFEQCYFSIRLNYSFAFFDNTHSFFVGLFAEIPKFCMLLTGRRRVFIYICVLEARYDLVGQFLEQKKKKKVSKTVA